MNKPLLISLVLFLIISSNVYALSFQDVANFFSSIFNSIASFFSSAFSVLVPKPTPTGGGGGGGGSSPPSCSISMSLSLTGKDTCTVTATVTTNYCDNKSYEIKDTACSGTTSGNSSNKTCTWSVTSGSYTYNLYVDNQNRLSKSVTCPKTPPTCSDGTLYGQCSSTKPKYCDNGNLIDKCTQCGCSSGQNCNSTTNSCYVPSQKCSDGTLYEQCSATKPKYCNSGTLINKCSQCGCPIGQSCNATTGSCYIPSVSTCDSTCKSQGYSSGTCRTNNINANLADIPDDWGLTYGLGPQIIFLDNNVVRTAGKPSIRLEPHTTNDVNTWRECDGTWYPVNPGDHIVAKCWIKVDPTYVYTGTDPYYYNGGRLGMDLYAPKGDDTITVVDGYPHDGAEHISSEVNWGTIGWTQKTWDIVIPSTIYTKNVAGTPIPSTPITQMVLWLDVRPTNATGLVWFADCELYINPTSSSETCQSDETFIEQDGCSDVCCCKAFQSPIKKFLIAYGFDGGFTDEQINFTASNFDMIDMGWYSNSKVCEGISKLKQKNPNITVIIYADAIGTKNTPETTASEWNWSEIDSHKDWFLLDKDGNRIENSKWKWYVMNISNEGWRKYYADWCVDKIQRCPGIDGIFADDVWDSFANEDVPDSFWNPWTVSNIKIPREYNQTWYRDMKGFLSYVKSRIGNKLLIPNTGDNADYVDVSDGKMEEGYVHPAWWRYDEFYDDWFIPAEKINNMKNLIAKGKYILLYDGLVTDQYPTNPTPDQVKKMLYYSLSSYLLAISGNKAAFSFNDWWTEDWQNGNSHHGYYPEMDYAKQLGYPTGTYYSYQNVLARDFENGKILVNPSTSSYTVSLGGSYKTLDGQTVSSITMNDHTGAILFKP